jgi:hypothetical protein
LAAIADEWTAPRPIAAIQALVLIVNRAITSK